MLLSTLRQSIAQTIVDVTVPTSARTPTLTTLREVETMDMESPGLDDPHLTFLVEHLSTQIIDRARTTNPELRSVYDIRVQVRARMSTIDAQTDVDAGLDVVDAIRLALSGDYDGASLRVESVESFGADVMATRYMYGIRLSAEHRGGA